MSKEENFKLLKIQTIVLKVHIHCEGCKKKVKKLLQKVDGVYTTDIDAEQQKVTVTGNIDSETLIKRLLKSGKHAELWPTSAKGNQQKQQNEQKPHKVQFDLGEQKPFKGQEAKDQKPQKGSNKGVADWFDGDFELKDWKDKVNGGDGKKGGAGGGGGGDNDGAKKGGGGDNGGGKKGGGGGDNGGGKKGGGGGDGQSKGGGGGDGGKKSGGGDGQSKAAGGGGGNEGKNNGGAKKGGGNPNQNGGGGKKNGGGDGGDNQNGGKKNGGGDGGDSQGGGGGEPNKNGGGVGGGGGGGGGGKKGGKKGGNGGGDGEGSINGYGDDGDFNNPPMFVVGNGGGGGVGCICHGGVGGYGYAPAPHNFHPGYRGDVNDSHRYMMMSYRPQYPMPHSQHNPADYATHLFSDENTSGCSIM